MPVVPGVEATPGKGAQVPLYILGSSTYGARLAALLGLPYAFASHFAPQALEEAVAIYRREFRPSAQLEAPYVMAGVNVIAAATSAEAREQLLLAQRHRVNARLGRGRVFTDEEADSVLRSPVGEQILETFTYSAVGNPAEVGEYVHRFAKHAQADELDSGPPTVVLRGPAALGGAAGRLRRAVTGSVRPSRPPQLGTGCRVACSGARRPLAGVSYSRLSEMARSGLRMDAT